MAGATTEAKVAKQLETASKDGPLLSLLAYVFGILGGIVVYVIAKDKFTKFHGMQALVLGAVEVVLSFTLILSPLSLLVWLYGLYVGIVYAYKGQKYKIPYIGDFAEKHSG
jgi:uncharacterized membrane protein